MTDGHFNYRKISETAPWQQFKSFAHWLHSQGQFRVKSLVERYGKDDGIAIAAFELQDICDHYAWTDRALGTEYGEIRPDPSAPHGSWYPAISFRYVRKLALRDVASFPELDALMNAFGCGAQDLAACES